MADQVTAEAAQPAQPAQSAGRRGWPLAATALRAVAEAGWVTVVYAATAVIVSHRAPQMGPVEVTALVALGIVVAWWGRRHEDLGPVLLIVAVMVGGVLGWLASAEARAALPNLAPSFEAHLAGFMGGIAVLRGALITPGPRAADQVESMMRSVPIGLGLIWAYTTLAAHANLWLPFAVAAMWGTVAFLSSSLVAMGLARLRVLHATVADPRTKRAWRWLVVAVGFGVVPIAIPIGVLSGIPLADMLNPVVGPMQWLFGLLAIPLAAIVWVLSEILRPVAGPLGKFLDEWSARIAKQKPPPVEEASQIGTLVGLALWAFTILVVLLAIFLFARWVLRHRQAGAQELDPAAADIQREIVVPAREPKPVAVRRRRRGAPHDLVAAYVAAVAELDEDPAHARLPSETPAHHAARLQREGVETASDLARLAAGYQLARYGARRITALENLRALGRFQRIRRAVRG